MKKKMKILNLSIFVINPFIFIQFHWPYNQEIIYNYRRNKGLFIKYASVSVVFLPRTLGPCWPNLSLSLSLLTKMGFTKDQLLDRLKVIKVCSLMIVMLLFLLRILGLN